MLVKDIAGYIESIVPLQLQEDYDNSGLILGNPGFEVLSVLVSLDVTEEVLNEAIARGCNLIIAHHPIIFKGIRKLTGADQEQRTIMKALENHVAVYALHTNLDNSYDGLNAILCRKLGMVDYRILLPSVNKLSKLVTFCPPEHAEKVRMALFNAGAGHIGNYDCCSYNLEGQGTFRAMEGANPYVGKINELHFEKETRIEVIFPNFLENKLIRSLIENHPYEEVAYDIYPLNNLYRYAGAGMIGNLQEENILSDFLSRMKEITGIPLIRYTAGSGRKIKKVALCTGSGSFLIREALSEKADIYLTADLKYHDFFVPSPEMVLADIGHYESEQFVKEWIYTVLKEKFPNFAVLISETNTNPVKYH